MKTYIKPWILVLIGVIITIIAALINGFIISENNEIIESLESETANIETNIDHLWNNNLSIERKKDSAYIMALQNPNSELVHNYIIDTLRLAGSDKILDDKKNTFNILVNEVNLYQNEIIDRINNLYGEKITKEEQINQIKKINSKFTHIAFFLQIIGLILVLSKDLAG